MGALLCVSASSLARRRSTHLRAKHQRTVLSEQLERALLLPLPESAEERGVLFHPLVVHLRRAAVATALEQNTIEVEHLEPPHLAAEIFQNPAQRGVARE